MLSELLNITTITKLLPEGRCVIEIILPPIQGTTLTDQWAPFSSIGVFESDTPLCSETSSTSCKVLALSTRKLLNKKS